MRRVNIQAAFLGEGGGGDPGDEEGLALTVRGGEVIVVVPAGTPDDRAVNAASTIRGSLRLETGRVLLFEIQGDAVGAFFEDEPAALFERREAAPEHGLSTLTAGAPSGFGGPGAIHGSGATARDVMSPQVVTVSPAHSVEEAARLLAFHQISGMPVVSEGEVVGVVSEADLIGKGGATVGDVMSQPAVVTAETAPLEEVATQLLAKGIRRLPVVDAEGRLAGVVSRADVLRWTAERGRIGAPAVERRAAGVAGRAQT